MTDNPYVNEVTLDNFDQRVLKASQQAPVLVDFWADWCGPCKMLMPILDKLAQEYAGKFTVAKVNTDQEQQLAMQFGVRSLPTVKVFRHGKMVNEFIGVQPEHVIRQLIGLYIEKPSDKMREQARAALADNAPDKAVSILQQALAADPENTSLLLDLIDALLQNGEVGEAQSRLDSLPLAERQTDKAKMLEARLTFANAVADAPDTKTLSDQIAATPDNLRARYQLGVKKVLAGDYEKGLEQLLEILKRDRKFENELGRKSLLAAFELIDNDDLVNRYRRQMASLLF